MPLQETQLISMVECASCPDCEKVLILGTLPPQSKRPFVEGRSQGWVIVCGGCGNEFAVRSGKIFQTAVHTAPLRDQKLGAA